MIRLPHSNIWKLFVIKGALWFMIIMPIIVLFFQDNGLNLQQIMTLQACYSLSLSIMEIPSGYAADIIGRRKTLILGCMLAFIGFSILRKGFKLLMYENILSGIFVILKVL